MQPFEPGLAGEIRGTLGEHLSFVVALTQIKRFGDLTWGRNQRIQCEVQAERFTVHCCGDRAVA